jgi:hypothetical protein
VGADDATKPTDDAIDATTDSTKCSVPTTVDTLVFTMLN